MLKVEYEKLGLYCQQDSFFKDLLLFNQITPSKREEILIQVLNFFRTSFSINHPILSEKRRETEDFLNLKLDNDKLWSLERDEKIEAASYMVSQNPGKTFRIYTNSIGSQSNLAKYFKRLLRENGLDPLKRDAYIDFINEVCKVLKKGNFQIGRAHV